MMRITVAERSPETGLSFRHARVRESPDLLLNVRGGTGWADGAGGAPSSISSDSGREGVAASPGRLVALLPGQGLVAEATVRQRLAAYRLTVAPGESLELRFAWGSATAVEGQWMSTRGRRALNGALELDSGLALHAAVRFNHAHVELARSRDGVVVRFTPPDGVLEVRLAMATTDLAGARGNLADGEGLGYEALLQATRADWNRALGRIRVTAPVSTQARVATDWYRVLAHYGNVADRDGRFRAADGSVRQVGEGRAYVGNLDLARDQWALIPLLALLAPEQMHGFAESLLLHQRVTGRFPHRTAWGAVVNDGATAPDDPAAAPAILAGWVSRGESDTEADRVLPPLIKASRETGLWTGYQPERAGAQPLTRILTASRLAQAVAVVAAAAGDRETAGAYAARAVFYRPHFDPQWAETLWTAALFDIDGLLELIGGRTLLAQRLDAAFTVGAGSGRLDATASATQHTPWLYGFSNRPERMRPVLNEVLAARGGVTAQDAAWRLFGVMGLYPVLPADGDYMLAPPAVEQVTLALGEELLTLTARLDDSWPGTVWMDGQPLPGRLVSHGRLERGGKVDFREPDPARGSVTGEGVGSEPGG
jgi:putative alpha-1,2-mannosidase